MADLIVATIQTPDFTETTRIGRGLQPPSYQELQHRSSVALVFGEPIQPDVYVDFNSAEEPDIVEPSDLA